MSETISNTLTLRDAPGPDETAHCCERCQLLTHEMLLTTGPNMVVVRVFGADSMKNAVRIGTSAERAMRIGAAFIRAALRLEPGLRAKLTEADRKNLALVLPETVPTGDCNGI
ncbi:MAG TPA: hypothetical protein VNZ94_01855 [Xanthobacteraceae bacterium]|nr:hypothetical protein [Xanthobacteraceae bacterium]